MTKIRIQNRKVTDGILYGANIQKWNCLLLEEWVFPTFGTFSLESVWGGTMKSNQIGSLFVIRIIH